MGNILNEFWIMMTTTTGFSQITGGMVIMWAVCAVLFFTWPSSRTSSRCCCCRSALVRCLPTSLTMATNLPVDGLINVPGGLYYYLSQGIHLELFLPIIFLGVGAMTDFAEHPHAFSQRHSRWRPPAVAAKPTPSCATRCRRR